MYLQRIRQVGKVPAETLRPPSCKRTQCSRIHVYRHPKAIVKFSFATTTSSACFQNWIPVSHWSFFPRTFSGRTRYWSFFPGYFAAWLIIVPFFPGHLEAGLVLQEREAGDLPADDHTKPLPLALQEQTDHVHGQVSSSFSPRSFVVCYYYIMLMGGGEWSMVYIVYSAKAFENRVSCLMLRTWNDILVHLVLVLKTLVKMYKLLMWKKIS